MLRYLPIALLIAAGLIPACTLDNPNYVMSSGESATTTAASTGGEGTATGTTTPDDGSGASASGSTATTSAGPTSSASDPSTSDDPSSSTTVTTKDPTDTDTGGALELEATLAACVLTVKDTFAHLGPEECAEKAAGYAEGIQGLLLLDKEFHDQDGKGRQALIFLQFEPPDWLENHTITMVQLHMKVAEHSNTEGSNADIHRCDPEEFDDLGDLDEEAPMSTEKLVMGAGDLVPGTAVTWGWGMEALEFPGCLRLEPRSKNTALYWGLDAKDKLDRPRLTITYE